MTHSMALVVCFIVAIQLVIGQNTTVSTANLTTVIQRSTAAIDTKITAESISSHAPVTRAHSTTAGNTAIPSTTQVAVTNASQLSTKPIVTAGNTAFSSTIKIAVTTTSQSITTPIVNDLTTVPIQTSTEKNATDNTNLTICFDVVGCFNNIPPNNNAGLFLPLSPEKLQSEFILFTRTNPDIGQALDYIPGFNFTASNFSPEKPTKVVTHGFSQNISTDWLADMKDEFLKNADVNVILVGWGNGATFPDYPLAVANTRMVATQLALVIQGLVYTGAKLANMHLIGHSLGAHVSGYTGRMFIGKIGRITGLEPAAPLFEGQDPEIRLDISDAIFVDIIHTNAAPIGKGGVGMPEELGHVDFYVNGGETQPGCPNGILSVLEDLLEGKSGGIGKEVSCSHGRSHQYFIESINSACPFTSYPCDDKEQFESGMCRTCGTTGCSQMGYHSDQYKARGKMFLATSSSEPFCGYHYFVQLVTNETETKGKVWMRLNGTQANSAWFLATGGDVDLNPNKPLKHAAISDVEVGHIETIELRYEKHHGFWFGGGGDKWEFSEAEVTSGEDGVSHYICERENHLNQLKDTVAEMFVSSTVPC